MVGVGYVGLVTGTCLAEIGNIVTCVDVNEKRIENLKKGISPIFEPGIEELITKNVNAERLFFSNNLKSILNEQDIIFIAVGTPPKENGEADLQYVEAVAHEIGKNIQKNLIIVNKSTVPIGTGDTVTQIIREYYGGEFSVVSNPEFLREGTAIDDFLHADRVVLGCDNHAEAIKIMQELYQPLECPILVTDLKSAEMIKYASNSFLAMSISFINSVANICEKVGADVLKVSEGMRLDKRIGKKAFITAGCGYGGSCFPKDVQALINIGRQNNETFTILEETEKVNEIMKTKIFHKLKKHHPDLVGKKVALWGVAFKPLTDDLRFAPALKIIEKLLAENASISVFDPVAHANLKNIHPQLHYADSPQEAVKDADILLVVTEWKHFKEIKLFEIKELMKGLVIIDGRNIFDPEEARSYGFIYESIGRRPHQNHFYL
ncbi:MAG: UDP-glucose/GDP-mannose dehydrogenase family protein [Patescibacteria group bacterium]